MKIHRPYQPSRLAGHVHNGIAKLAGVVAGGLSGIVAFIDSGARNFVAGVKETALDSRDAAVATSTVVQETVMGENAQRTVAVTAASTDDVEVAHSAPAGPPPPTMADLVGAPVPSQA